MKPDNATILAAIKAHATTKSYAEIAAMLGLSSGTVAHIGYEAGIKKPHVQGMWRAKLAHHREVIQAHAMTHTLKEIGRMLGLTKERVRQLCAKWQIERRDLKCSPLRWMSDRELRKLVRQPDKTLAEIAAEAGAEHGTLTRELRRRGIEPFTRRERNARLLKMGKRVCCHCRRTKPVEQFSRDASEQSGYKRRCLECNRASASEWRERQSSKRRKPVSHRPTRRLTGRSRK